jgi:DNA-binding MarR family transcriptional regulator
MSLREIARAVDADRPAATAGVDKLEARGLVHRTAHPDDNRRKLVHLTDSGREAAQRRQTILNEQDGEVTLIDGGLSGYRDTLESALSVFDRRLRNPGLSVRQA